MNVLKVIVKVFIYFVLWFLYAVLLVLPAIVLERYFGVKFDSELEIAIIALIWFVFLIWVASVVFDWDGKRKRKSQ